MNKFATCQVVLGKKCINLVKYYWPIGANITQIDQVSDLTFPTDTLWVYNNSYSKRLYEKM